MIENSTVNNVNELNAYDDTGAMIYIVMVLFWYSIGIIIMLGMQMRARSEIIEGTARHRTKILIRNLRDHSNTKEILEELVDKKKRARLWEIYLGTETTPEDKLTRAETGRIRNIEKRLAAINRNRRPTSETLFSMDETRYHRTHSHSRPIPTPDLSSLVVRRRSSSFDEQQFEQLKTLAKQSKTQEQMSWNTGKLLIGKYFHRPTKRSLSTIEQEESPDLSLFTDQISNLTQHRSQSDLDQLTSADERQNPYLTYFCKSDEHHPTVIFSGVE